MQVSTPPSSTTPASDAQATLAAWLAIESAAQERLANGPGWGVAGREQVAGLDGLQLMQAMLRGELPGAPIGRTMDFLLVEAERGRAVFQGRPGAAHLNPMGGIHDGWFATLLDSALGCAVHTMMPVGRGYTTAELGVNIVRGLTPKVQLVRAEGQVVHCGRQLATATARLYGPDGTLYAHASTTCLVFELPPQSKT